MKAAVLIDGGFLLSVMLGIVCAGKFAGTVYIEFFFPLLALAVLYLLSWLASLYLLVQFILGVRAKRRLASWSILWLSVWPFFALGIAADNLSWGHPFSMLELAGNFCTFFIPFLWLFALGLFRKTVAAEKRKSAEQERQFIQDIYSRNDVWPPPPAGRSD